MPSRCFLCFILPGEDAHVVPGRVHVLPGEKQEAWFTWLADGSAS